MTAFRPDADIGRQEHLQHRVREHHGAHVAAIRHEPGGLAEPVLALEKRLANLRAGRHAGGGGAHRLLPDGLGHVLAAEP